MKVLLLGAGGRESALALALARSKVVTDLFALPGNPGIGAVASLLHGDPADPATVLDAAEHVDAHLTVVGPEAPLVAGVSDALRARGRLVFGPDQAASRIEASKSYAKELMDSAGIPTAKWRAFDAVEPAIAYMDHLGAPYVIKADGLAGGKGVVVTDDRAEAVAAIEERLVRRRFGASGATIVVEEFLDGEEASLIAFSDGSSIVPCEPAQDYKRVYDDDRGLNTGGMGSYSPVPACPPDVAAEIMESVIRPIVQATRERGAPFVGALYAGVALTRDGPKVVEFNARFGDPETQALLPRFRSDVGELCLATARKELAGASIEWSSDVCVSVVLASGGYPGSHETGFPIKGLEEAAGIDGVSVFHAGTARAGDAIVTAGGRVLAVSALAPDFAAARAKAYEAASSIEFEGRHMRTDIAKRAEAAVVR